MKSYNREQSSNIPGLDYELQSNNPVVSSPLSPYELPFYQTREDLLDIDVYKRFLVNAEKRFRQSNTYTLYKSRLIDLGLDRCQVHGNINAEMATIEMHHNVLTLFDITYIIAEHILNTTGFISTFDLVYALKKVHVENKVQLVMLSLTPHQLYHNSEGLYIHPSMCFGNWMEFLKEYKYGISIDIANKVIEYLELSMDIDKTYDSGILDLVDKLKDWSVYNERSGKFY